jgi:hypothetical protein
VIVKRFQSHVTVLFPCLFALVPVRLAGVVPLRSMHVELTGPSAFADLTDLHILGLSPSALDGALLTLTTSNQRVLHLLGTLCANSPTCIPFENVLSSSPACVLPTMSRHQFRTLDGVIDIYFRISCFSLFALSALQLPIVKKPSIGCIT